LKDVFNRIREQMEQAGFKVATVSVTHLPEVQESVASLVRQGLVNKRLSDTWHFYLDSNKNLPEAKTIIIAAMPEPITRVWFKRQGVDHTADIPPAYFFKADSDKAEAILKVALERAGYRLSTARLALKTLAVRSGLARYGRNNISYVPGMGSFCRLIAFYTDCPCAEDNWKGTEMMEDCRHCSICRENCPTGSIIADRFLVQAEKCLGFLSQMEPVVPYWVRFQPGWPNALVGCMRCQFACPADRPYLKNILTGPVFSEEETDLILNQTPLENLPAETRLKLESGLAELYPRLPANLTALIQKQNAERL
jgi:epoxyqueuosine reductase